MHLLAITTLIVSAVSFGVLLFEYINIHVPDIVSDPYFSRSSHFSSLRYAMATLVIVFPVFLWVSWFITKDILKFPEKKELKIRKWLLYLTLFISALVIIGDLVALMRSFLEGELSQRFILKVLAILFIAGSIFIHYLSELKERTPGFRKLFDWVVIAVVFTAIAGGFYTAGSPQNQRLVRLDERRISDLQTIQWQIINYWQRKSALPGFLSDLNDPIGGFVVPRDPVRGADYEYRVLGKLSFELCSVFDTASIDDGADSVGKPAIPRMAYPEGVYPESQNIWRHEQGKVCFERTIDPDLYPPVNDKIKPRPL